MKAEPSSKSPPAQCGAVVRLKMKALKEGKTAATDSGEESDADAVACPGDMVYADGACTKDTETPHQCEPGNAKSCAAQCDAGDASSCGILASMYWKGDGGDKDWNKSAALHVKGCSGDNARSCRYAGRAYRTGQGAKKDEKRAAKLLTKACESADGLGCVELGLLHASKKRGDEALGMFRKACYGGEFEGCSQLGVMYKGGKGGLRKSPKLATKFFEKGCKEGSPLACHELALALKSGKGIAKDKTRAEKLMEKTCSRGYEATCGE